MDANDADTALEEEIANDADVANEADTVLEDEIANEADVANEAVVLNTFVVALKVNATESTRIFLAPVVPSVNAT